MFASLFFVFGLLSFLTKPENGSSVTEQFNLQEKNTNNHSSSKEVVVEEQMVSVINLHVYFDNVNGKIQPSTAFSSRAGFVSGTNWITKNIDVEKSSTANKYSYNVTGVLEWRILGFTLFSENKIFNGELSLL